MARSFHAFWRQFSTGRVAALTVDSPVLLIPPDTFRDLMRAAYDRGGIDVLLDMSELELTAVDELKREVAADRIHAEWRAELPAHHFAGRKIGLATPPED